MPPPRPPVKAQPATERRGGALGGLAREHLIGLGLGCVFVAVLFIPAWIGASR